MAKAISLYDTTIGKKVVVALTGAVLYGFVVAHMLGNLQVFLGPEQLNGYAHKLHALGPLLWLARGVLLVCLFAHVAAVMQLAGRTAAARPVAYRMQKNAVTSHAALTMRYGGIAIFAFVVFHIAHFTAPGVAMSATYQHDAADVYANVVHGFSVPWVAALYVVAQLALGMHLYHGASSLFQTLGMNHPRYNARRDLAARAVGFAVVAGNISIPAAVLAGVVR